SLRTQRQGRRKVRGLLYRRAVCVEDLDVDTGRRDLVEHGLVELDGCVVGRVTLVVDLRRALVESVVDRRVKPRGRAQIDDDPEEREQSGEQQTVEQRETKSQRHSALPQGVSEGAYRLQYAALV